MFTIVFFQLMYIDCYVCLSLTVKEEGIDLDQDQLETYVVLGHLSVWWDCTHGSRA